MKRNSSARVRYAVVGLGYIAQAAVLPAFKNAKENSELVALVSGDTEKLDVLSKKYKTRINCTYESYDDLLRSGEIDAVYIALPNHLHREFTERAAEAKIHILCEKPMAVTAKDCLSMIEKAKDNRVKLMIAYRLHFEAGNLEAIRIVRSGSIGEPKYFNSSFSMQVAENNIRTNPIDEGGGTIYDIGIYCLNAARNIFDAEPTEVFALSENCSDSRFKDMDETSVVGLRFPGDRLATFVTSFGAADKAVYSVVGTKGSIELENAYEWTEDLCLTLKIKDRAPKKMKFSKRDQFGPEIVYFSDCILNKKAVEPSGEEGYLDVRVIEAIYEAAETKKLVRIPEKNLKDRSLSPDQEIKKPAFKKIEDEELVDAAPPTAA